MKIQVEPVKKDGSWRAFVRVPADMRNAPGVMGSATQEGPWIEAFGRTPDRALRSLYLAIGKAYVRLHGGT